MKPFEFKQGNDPWQGGTLLHFYADVDWDDGRHQALGELVRSSNRALLDAGLPITPVEPRWLHITIDQVSRAAPIISQVERDQLVEEVSSRLTGFAPFEVTVGSLLSYHSGVIADLHPDQELAALHAATRDGIRTALGDDACQYGWGVQHLTTAYAHGEADSDAAQRILRRVRPSHAPLHITAIHLVDVAAATSDSGKTVTWEHLKRIPLNGTPSVRHTASLWWNAGRLAFPVRQSGLQELRWHASLRRVAALLEPVWPRDYSTGTYSYSLGSLTLLLYAGQYDRDLRRGMEEVSVTTIIDALSTLDPRPGTEAVIREGLMLRGHDLDSHADEISALFQQLTAYQAPLPSSADLPASEQPRSGTMMQWGTEWAYTALKTYYLSAADQPPQRYSSAAGARRPGG